MCFDLSRKVTYKNIENWYSSLVKYRPNIPILLLANKVDLDERQARKSFRFSEKHNIPLFFVSASNGTNVVAAFRTAIDKAIQYKMSGTSDFVEDVLKFIHEEGGFLDDENDRENDSEETTSASGTVTSIPAH
jgi:Rab-like protein 2